MHEFPAIKFLIWTGAAQVEKKISKGQAIRAKDFFDWVKYDWDIPADNVYIESVCNI